MPDDRTKRSEQSGISQNIPTKRRQSSTSHETQLKRKKKGDLHNYSFCLHHTIQYKIQYKNKSYNIL